MTQLQRERKLLLESMFALSFHPSQWWERDDDKQEQEQQRGKLMWVFRRIEDGSWQVGFYCPEGKWHSDGGLCYETSAAAATRCSWLNGWNGGK